MRKTAAVSPNIRAHLHQVTTGINNGLIMYCRIYLLNDHLNVITQTIKQQITTVAYLHMQLLSTNSKCSTYMKYGDAVTKTIITTINSTNLDVKFSTQGFIIRTKQLSYY